MSILKKIGLGLATVILAACTDLPVKCRTYNNSTVSLNQSTDGISARLEDLQTVPTEGIISEAFVDFMNETQALSSEGLPERTNVTLVDQECLDVNGDLLGHPVVAYAITSNDTGWQRGIYVPSVLSLTNYNFRLLAHEIGHLQTAGGGYDEVIPELNSVEQVLNSYALLNSQFDHYPDHINWVRDFVRTVPGTFLTEQLDQNGDHSDLQTYMKADIFVLMKLFGHNGDFNQVRQEIITLVDSGDLESAVEEEVREFENQYNIDFYQGSIAARRADVSLLADLYFFRALEQRFGRDVAAGYFSSSSLFPYQDKTPMIGLLDLNCRVAREESGLPGMEKEKCPAQDPKCASLEAEYRIPRRATFCCWELIETPAGSAFSKWLVDGIGHRYIPREDQSLTLSLNFSWSGPVDVLQMYSRRQISLVDRCAEKL